MTKHSNLIQLRNELNNIVEAPYPQKTWDKLELWLSKVTPIIRKDWPDFFEDFQKNSSKSDGFWSMSMSQDFKISESEKHFQWERDNKKTEQVRQKLISYLDGLLLTSQTSDKSAVDTVVFICRRFPIFAKELSKRGRNRTPLIIQDEYDVQYLLLALLRLHFDDVRPEVQAHDYAGGSSRIDFLLKQEKIAVETKKTRDSLKKDKDIADELIIDARRYAEYPDCNLLICFIYDPDKLIDNPKGLEKDLSGTYENIKVLVVVSPQDG